MRKVTVRVSSLEPGKLRGQEIVRAESRRYRVSFDYVGGVFQVGVGDKIVLEFHESKPKNMSKYLVCGHGYLVSKPEDPYTLFSVWGIIFRIEPRIELEPGKKYYLCIRKAQES